MTVPKTPPVSVRLSKRRRFIEVDFAPNLGPRFMQIRLGAAVQMAQEILRLAEQATAHLQRDPA